MKLVQIVILLGPQCVSPLEQTPGITEVAQVPCAIVIERQKDRSQVQVKPGWQRKNPVVALLSERQTLVSMEEIGKAGVKSAASVPAGTDAVPRPQPRPQQIASLSQQDTRALSAAPQQVKKKAPRKTVRKAAAKRADRCGSMRADWYTNKEGRRKYRCVK